MKHTHYLLTDIDGENIAVIARTEDYTHFFWNKVRKAIEEHFTLESDDMEIINHPDAIIHEEIVCEFKARYIEENGYEQEREFILSQIEIY